MFPNEAISNVCIQLYLYFPCRHSHNLLVLMVFPFVIGQSCKYAKVSCLKTHFEQDVKTRELIGNSICWNYKLNVLICCMWIIAFLRCICKWTCNSGGTLWEWSWNVSHQHLIEIITYYNEICTNKIFMTYVVLEWLESTKPIQGTLQDV